LEARLGGRAAPDAQDHVTDAAALFLDRAREILARSGPEDSSRGVMRCSVIRLALRSLRTREIIPALPTFSPAHRCWQVD